MTKYGDSVHDQVRTHPSNRCQDQIGSGVERRAGARLIDRMYNPIFDQVFTSIWARTVIHIEGLA